MTACLYRGFLLRSSGGGVKVSIFSVLSALVLIFQGQGAVGLGARLFRDERVGLRLLENGD